MLIADWPVDSAVRTTKEIRNFPTANETPDAARARRYKESYAAAAETLQRAGIDTRPDDGSYANERKQWEPLIRRVAPTLEYRMDEIDCRPQDRSARAERG